MDFVSFKLDVDNSEVEIPVALEILTDPIFKTLITDFFLSFTSLTNSCRHLAIGKGL